MRAATPSCSYSLLAKENNMAKFQQIQWAQVIQGDYDPDTDLMEGRESPPSLVEWTKIEGDLILIGLEDLQSLPPNIYVKGSAELGGCIVLHSLPGGFAARRGLNCSGCESLEEIPDDLYVGDDPVTCEDEYVEGADVSFRDCTALKRLPEDFYVTGNLDLKGCTALEGFPGGLRVDGDLDLRGTRFQPEDLPRTAMISGRILTGERLPFKEEQSELL
jgi:hypothetical protein